jgi:hypothetical protein
MTEREKPTAEQPVVSPSVSTDPGPGPWHISRLPSHLGRARTSTLVLSLLFVAIGALYLNIRPDQPPPPASTVSDTGTVPAPATTAPTPTSTPEPTTTAPETTTDEVPTTTTEPTPTEEPTETTTPEETDETSPPTFSSPSSPASSPTVVSPPG